MVRYSSAKKPFQFYTVLVSLLVSYLLIRYLTAYPDFVDILNSYEGEKQPPSLSSFLFSQLINFSLTFIIGMAMRLYKNVTLADRKAHDLEAQVNQANMQMLKYQINPHFLYNTLSYMYAQARPLSESLAKSILILADMMRHTLNKIDEKGYTSLTKEINYIENFIEIHRLRFDEDFYVNFEVEGVINGRKIVPMVLITFVENAFKHGQLNDSRYPITIKLIVRKNSLSFVVKNHKQLGIKDATSGIGLNNTRKRLQLAYPNQHSLSIFEDNSHFEVALMIKFYES